MGLPQGFRILNAKEKKVLSQALNSQFSITTLPEGVYLENTKKKVFVLNRELELIEYTTLRIDSLGLYIGVWQVDGFRLSIEGAQLLGGQSDQNYELSDEQMTAWLKGEDVPVEEEVTRFVIVHHGNDILGCGKIKISDEKNIVINFTPKARRLVVVNE